MPNIKTRPGEWISTQHLWDALDANPKWTYSGLAAKLGVGHSTLYRWLHHEDRAPAWTKARLAEILANPTETPQPRRHTNRISADHIQAFLERTEWTQCELADELGISQSALSRWLSTNNAPLWTKERVKELLRQWQARDHGEEPEEALRIEPPVASLTPEEEPAGLELYALFLVTPDKEQRELIAQILEDTEIAYARFTARF